LNGSEGTITPLAIDPFVGRVQVKQIGVHGVTVVKPTFGKRVLPVVKLVFATTTAAPVLVIPKYIIRDVGINIPHLAVGSLVGLLKGRPQVAVRQFSMPFDGVVQRRLQRLTTQSLRRSVIPLRWAGRCNADSDQQPTQHSYAMFHLPLLNNQFLDFPGSRLGIRAEVLERQSDVGLSHDSRRQADVAATDKGPISSGRIRRDGHLGPGGC